MSTIIQTTKANGVHKANGACSAKQPRPATVRAHVPSAETVKTVAPMISRALAAVTEAVAELDGQETYNPATERESLAVTIGTPKRDERTITACITDWQETGDERPETYITIETDDYPIACNPEQARTAASRLHYLANHIEKLAAKVDPPAEWKPPFWLTKRCPSWCGSIAASPGLGHTDTDCQEDRNHFMSLPNIDLTLYDDRGTDFVTDAKIGVPGQMFLSVNQHYREAEPVVSITVPETTRTDREWLVTGEQDVRMTVAEARALRDQLTGLLDLIDGGAE